jgi:hypothetical protein
LDFPTHFPSSYAGPLIPNEPPWLAPILPSRSGIKVAPISTRHPRDWQLRRAVLQCIRPLAKEIKTARSFQSTKPNCFFRGAVDRGCIGSGLRTIERLPRLLRKLGQQVRPVPSDNAAYAVVYNIDAIEGLNLTADDFKVVWTQAATIEKFHWHGGPMRESRGSFRK